MQHRLVHDPRAAEVAAALLRHPRSQVAGARGPMLRLARGGQAKSLFGPLVGLHLGHGSPRLAADFASWKAL